jgi:hypothetical protein
LLRGLLLRLKLPDDLLIPELLRIPELLIPPPRRIPPPLIPPPLLPPPRLASALFKIENVNVLESKLCVALAGTSYSTIFTEGEKSPSITATIANLSIKNLLLLITTPSLQVLQY